MRYVSDSGGDSGYRAVDRMSDEAEEADDAHKAQTVDEVQTGYGADQTCRETL